MLDSEGHMQADLTCIKLAEDRFMLVVTDTQHNHVLHLMKNRLNKNSHCFINDVTNSFAQLNIMGPKSRELMEKITVGCDLTNSGFKFRDAKEVEIGYAHVLAVRITYVGELGWELYVPTEQASHVYDVINKAYGEINAGDVPLVGLKALGSLRLEKGYRDFGHDIDNTDTILSAGLSFTCNFDKSPRFIGRDAVLKQKEERKVTLSKRMVNVLCLTDRGDVMFHHGEIVRRDGVEVGEIRAGSYGHSLGGCVGLMMCERRDGEPVTKKWLERGDWTVEVGGSGEHACQVRLEPFYDPKNDRINI